MLGAKDRDGLTLSRSSHSSDRLVYLLPQSSAAIFISHLDYPLEIWCMDPIVRLNSRLIERFHF